MAVDGQRLSPLFADAKCRSFRWRVRNRVVTVNRGCGGFAAGRATQRGLSLFGVNDFSLRQRWHARYKDWSGYPTPWHFGKAVKRAR